MASNAARGPLAWLLKSPTSQLAVLGSGGAYVLYPEKVREALPGLDGLFSASSHSSPASTAAVPHIITIQTPAASDSSSSVGTLTSRAGMISVIVYTTVGAGLCWIGYVVCTTAMPEAVAKLMPVTKATFEKATQVLGRGILNLKKVLEEKILGLSKQQDELARKQDATKESVDNVASQLDQARGDLTAVRDALDRCEDSLDSTAAMQNYTMRGVKLLVKCVTTFMPQGQNNNNNSVHGGEDPHGYLRDIARFIQEGEAHEQHRQHQQQMIETRSTGGTPIAQAHAIVPTINGVPAMPSISSIPEHSSSEDDTSPYSGSEGEIVFHHSATTTTPYQTPPPPQHKLRRAHSAPRAQLNPPASARSSPARRFAASEASSAPRPNKNQAVLFGGPDATPEIVDIQALLGH
mmetsp:Transcript_22301/g.48456  ORF Transcript_22301/g.48456 Transcript_22301/m.48456 type:complete len:407 (-) Transcript_22301:2101-3321(-)|eukprot:CAMPEP_0168742352 /NCGR_PEP_ID=MMETSP0724-20121128/12992_1 /TAXON_ID=265536 /ORGANISM="Amphiprora sp., Strain CCMP467" /LENGTH=406 /DNA_ID=CAMNT_0008789899 /DNA_START=219 /DNA_END=1439 /DNA_ORIENTATION=-